MYVHETSRIPTVFREKKDKESYIQTLMTIQKHNQIMMKNLKIEQIQTQPEVTINQTKQKTMKICPII